MKVDQTEWSSDRVTKWSSDNCRDQRTSPQLTFLGLAASAARGGGSDGFAGGGGDVSPNKRRRNDAGKIADL
jgi:hypothetical protein